MESLIKQTRSRFSGNKEEGSSTADRKIPPHKTQTFGEKRRSQGWIKRQLSRQMSWDNDFSGTDYPTAVAAAAYAIQSLEESKYLDRKETKYGPDKSLSKMSNIKDEEKIEPLKSALKYSDETLRPGFKDSESTSTRKKMPERKPSIRRISFSDDMDEASSNKPEKGAIEKPPEKAPSLRRPPTFANQQLDITERRPETILPKPNRPPTKQYSAHPVDTRRPATIPGPGDSAADAWEKEQLASIKERYEKLRATIDNWEMKKKNKAKRKIEKIEAELDKDKVKAVRKYHNEVTRIEGIAGGAKAQAEKNRRNEEFKVKEKANKIRATGKLPPTCLCF